MKRRGEWSKSELYAAREEHREICREKQNNWQEKKREKINKSRNMSQWWVAVNAFRRKPRGEVSKEISKRQWVNHFQGVLASTQIM